MKEAESGRMGNKGAGSAPSCPKVRTLMAIGNDIKLLLTRFDESQRFTRVDEQNAR